MADAKPAKARNGEDKKPEQAAPPPPPPVGVVLELYFPMTKAILPTNFMSEAEAVRAAFDHFTAFPSGYAQVRDAPTNRVLLNHQQLFQRFRGR
jgi:hypothetical protein